MNDPLLHRKTAARMANRAREAGEPSDWFEPFYQWAQGAEEKIPWADLAPHPLLVEFFQDQRFGKVAVVGCGLGDDAEFVARHADEVWAFDVADSAVAWARRRFPASPVEYETANLFALPVARKDAFDLVVEIYTLQALPPESRFEAMRVLAELPQPGGELVIITRLRPEYEPLGPIPWPLLRSELDSLRLFGLSEIESSHIVSGDPVRSVWKKS